MSHSSHPQVPKIWLPAPLVYALGIVVGGGLEILFPLPIVPLMLFPVGIFLILAGLGLALWSALTMHHGGVSMDPNKPTDQLVQSGPFHWTRNPIYVAMSAVYAGASLCLKSPWLLGTLVVILLVVHYGIILPEERYLIDRFGAPYQEYCHRVRRWL